MEGTHSIYTKKFPVNLRINNELLTGTSDPWRILIKLNHCFSILCWELPKYNYMETFNLKVKS